MSDTTEAPQEVDFDRLAGKYVKLRDKIHDLEAEQKKQIAPYKDTLEKLSDYMLEHLNRLSADSVKTSAGTVSRLSKHTASIADMSAFWTWVVAQGNFDFVDKKANVTAVHDFIETHKIPVPGVNFSTRQVVGVRRPTKKDIS